MSITYFAWNLTPKQGVTLYRAALCKDNQTTPQPFDFTNWTAKAQIRLKIDDVAVVHELTTTNGEIVLGRQAGLVELHVAASITATWTFKTAVWQLNVTSPDGTVTKCLFQGQVVLNPSVVR